jgi:hypothetical protein
MPPYSIASLAILISIKPALRAAGIFDKMKTIKK